MELALRRRRRRRRRRHRLARAARRRVGDRRTAALAGVALVTTGTVAAGEVWRIWRHGDAPLPRETDDVLGAGAEALGQTLEAALVGYRGGTRREHALLNLMLSFFATWISTRATSHMIRRRGRVGPIGNVVLGGRHVHHFVPGIVLAFVAGGVAIVTRRERLEPWLALPFGAGVAMTLDESALLLQLEDVYWTEEGVVSVQITLATLAILSALILALRIVRRGEAEVLPAAGAGPYAAAPGASSSSSSRTPSPQTT
jgi:hypothetical protein